MMIYTILWLPVRNKVMFEICRVDGDEPCQHRARYTVQDTLGM